MNTATLALLISAATTTVSWAEQHCGGQMPLSVMNGTYQVEIGTSLLFGGNKVIPLRASGQFNVTMEAQGDLLMMEADQTVIVLEWADGDDDALNFKDLQDLLNTNPGDLVGYTGCAFDALPILVGGGLASSSEGLPLDFEYQLAVADADGSFLMGVVHWTAGDIQALRAVTATRVN